MSLLFIFLLFCLFDLPSVSSHFTTPLCRCELEEEHLYDRCASVGGYRTHLHLSNNRKDFRDGKNCFRDDNGYIVENGGTSIPLHKEPCNKKSGGNDQHRNLVIADTPWEARVLHVINKDLARNMRILKKGSMRKSKNTKSSKGMVKSKGQKKTKKMSMEENKARNSTQPRKKEPRSPKKNFMSKLKAKNSRKHIGQKKKKPKSKKTKPTFPCPSPSPSQVPATLKPSMTEPTSKSSVFPVPETAIPITAKPTVEPSPSQVPETVSPTANPTEEPFVWIQLGLTLALSPTVCSSRFSLDLSGDGVSLALALSNSFDGEYNATVFDFDEADGRWRASSLSSSLDFTATSISRQGNHVALSQRSTGTVSVYEKSGGGEDTGFWSQIGVPFAGGFVTQKTPVAIGNGGFTVAVAYPASDAPVRVYDYDGFNFWILRGNTSVVDSAVSEGISISEDGNVIAFDNLVFEPGVYEWTVRVYEWDGISWRQRGDHINGTVHELSADGNRLAVGNEFEDFVHIYDWDSRNWVEVGGPIPPLLDFFTGNRVCLSGDGNVVGVEAPGNVAQAFRLDEDLRWAKLGGIIAVKTSSGSDAHCALNFRGDVLAVAESDCTVAVYGAASTTARPRLVFN